MRKHVFQLGGRFVIRADPDERTPERDPGRNVGRVPQEAGAAGVDGVAELSEAAILLGERREGYRRRVPLDPAPQFFQSGGVSHGPVTCYGTIETAVAELVVVRPKLSVTVSVT